MKKMLSLEIKSVRTGRWQAFLDGQPIGFVFGQGGKYVCSLEGGLCLQGSTVFMALSDAIMAAICGFSSDKD